MTLSALLLAIAVAPAGSPVTGNALQDVFVRMPDCADYDAFLELAWAAEDRGLVRLEDGVLSLTDAGQIKRSAA